LLGLWPKKALINSGWVRDVYIKKRRKSVRKSVWAYWFESVACPRKIKCYYNSIINFVTWWSNTINLRLGQWLIADIGKQHFFKTLRASIKILPKIELELSAKGRKMAVIPSLNCSLRITFYCHLEYDPSLWEICSVQWWGKDMESSPETGRRDFLKINGLTMLKVTIQGTKIGTVQGSLFNSLSLHK